MRYRIKFDFFGVVLEQIHSYSRLIFDIILKKNWEVIKGINVFSYLKVLSSGGKITNNILIKNKWLFVTNNF